MPEQILKHSVDVSKKEAGGSARDYGDYRLSARQKLIYMLAAAMVVFAVSFLFYRSVVLSLLLAPLSLIYPGMKRKGLIERQKSELNLQFKDMLYSLSSSLSAGKSIEMSFREVLRDIEVLYPDKETYIIKEVELVIRKLEMNGTAEAALADFAARSHVGDIESFSEVFGICKRSGGNLVEVIKNTTGIINDKIEIRQEIDTLLSQRKFEQKVLSMMPVAMVLLLSLSAADYMEPVFATLPGRLAMSAAVVLFVSAYFISKRIMEVKL